MTSLHFSFLEQFSQCAAISTKLAQDHANVSICKICNLLKQTDKHENLIVFF